MGKRNLFAVVSVMMLSVFWNVPGNAAPADYSG
jgi:hypothetical protein